MCRRTAGYCLRVAGRCGGWERVGDHSSGGVRVPRFLRSFSIDQVVLHCKCWLSLASSSAWPSPVTGSDDSPLQEVRQGTHPRPGTEIADDASTPFQDRSLATDDLAGDVPAGDFLWPGRGVVTDV